VLVRAGGALLLVLLLVQALSPLRRDVQRYRLAAVASTNAVPVIPEGHLVLTEFVPVSRLRVGDVIAYDHPLRERAPVHARITQIEPIAGSTGYLVRLELGDPAGEPWFAELHLNARKVIFQTAPPGELVEEVASRARPVGVGLATTVAIALGSRLTLSWYRSRSRLVRSSRVTHG
jgi:hypothetical protein